MNKNIIILSAFITPFRSGAESCVEEVAVELSDEFNITIITARLKRNLPRRDSLHGKVSGCHLYNIEKAAQLFYMRFIPCPSYPSILYNDMPLLPTLPERNHMLLIHLVFG